MHAVATAQSTESLPINVLLIEDSEIQVRMIQALFDEQPKGMCAFQAAGDLQTGIQLLAENEFDAILLDLTLPDSEGVDSCVRVNEVAPTTPIVVLTGLDDQELAVATLQHGAEDYLVKDDIDSRLLVRAIRYAIERKRVTLALQEAHDVLELRVEERTAQLKKMQEEAVVRQEELAHAARLNTLGELASGIAHELNQPLMAIIGFTDTCLDLASTGDQDTERFENLLQDTGKEARRAAQIIKRMRKLVSGSRSERVLTSINDAITETIPLIRPGMGISIEKELDPSLPDTLLDRIQIQQVILNLASNAVHAMGRVESDTKAITIRSGKDDTGEMLFVEVSDTGPGLEQEDLDRLFQPFFSRSPDGLGLGLSISQSIVESHGGTLEVCNNEEAGLTFRFTINLESLDS